MIHILYNWDIILCCMDWRREVILGNVKTKNAYEIWNGEKYDKIRKMVNDKIESSHNFICKRCDQSLW